MFKSKYFTTTDVSINIKFKFYLLRQFIIFTKSTLRKTPYMLDIYVVIVEVSVEKIKYSYKTVVLPN